jgi:hypothetical protein
MCLDIETTKELMFKEAARGERGRPRRYGETQIPLENPGVKTVHINAYIGQDPNGEWRLLTD